MAGPENMAENAPTEAPARLYVTNKSGVVTETRPIVPPRPPEDPLLSPRDLERIRQEATRKGGNAFAVAETTFEHYSGGVFNGVHIRELSANIQAELQNRRDGARRELVRLKEGLEQEQGGNTILEHVRKAALEFFKRVRGAKSRERYGGEEREAILRTGRRGYYEEVVFDDSQQFKQLQTTYGGLPTYIFEGIVQEIDKEAHGRESPPLNALAEQEYKVVKQHHERERQKDQKYTEIVYFGGRIWEFLWPESAKDMMASTLDWVKDRISEVGNRDVGTVNKSLEEIRGRVVELLESCRVRLNSDEWFLRENKKITETDPNFLRARAFGEGVTDVLGNEKVMYKGNTEYGPQYKERYAAEFIAHHDEIYMAPKVAYIMHKLKTVKDGTYWFGHSWDVEKAEEGEITDYRQDIEEEVLDDAAIHDIFLSDDLTRGLYLDVNGDPILGKDGRHMGAFEYRDGGNPEKRDLRYSFDDNIEQLLLDPGDVKRQQIQVSGDLEALRRHDLRVKFFRDTRDRLDAEEGLAGLTTEQRQNSIRLRIVQKMQQKQREPSLIVQMTRESLAKLANARVSNNVKEYDRILWQWVKDYNAHRIDYRLRRWYPTSWERVRWNIDRPEKVLDRKLSKEEFEAMFEPILRDQPLEDDVIEQHKEQARIGFQLSKSYHIYHMQDVLLGGIRTRLRDSKTGNYIGKLEGDDEETREVNKRLGLTDANGNVINPNRVYVRIFDVVQTRLQIAIEKEEAAINQAKAELAQAQQGNDLQLIRNKKENLRNILINSQFLATHALKAAGLVEGKLPVWSHNFVDRSTFHAFAKLLAEYGVERYKGGEITHDAKKEMYEILERGRRGLAAEWHRAAGEFMVGTYPAYERDDIDGKVVPLLNNQGRPIQALGVGAEPVPVLNAAGEVILASGPKDQPLSDPQGRPYLVPKPAVSLWDASSDWGIPIEVRERFRVTSKGAVKEDTMITEAQFDISTSGGVAVPEMNPDMGDFGYYSLLTWLGATDIRELHGFIKRRDEAEYHRHKFFDVLDPVHNARAQAAGYIARRALTGGKIGEIGEGKTPGFLQEPYHAAFKSADWLQEQQAMAQSYGMDNTAKYLAIMQQGYRRAGLSYSQFIKTWQGQIPYTSKEGVLTKINMSGQDVERYRQLSYLDFDLMSKTMSDQFYQTMYGVLDYFQWCLKANRDITTSRAGRLYRNWEYDNTLKWYAFRRAMRESMARGETGFVIRLGYSPEVASEVTIRMMESVLLDADYLILRDYERGRLAMDGAKILSKALTSQERQAGFVIPDEKDWASQRPEVRTALENIRRRGLLEFMREEGYKIGNKEVLGKKIPPLAQPEVRKAKAKREGKKEEDYLLSA